MMNEKKEFLTEENYERGKKKVMRLALIVLVIGILIGGSLIAIGVIKSNEIKKANEQIAEQIRQEAKQKEEANKKRTADEVQADINSLQSQIDTLESEISNLNNEQQKILRDDMGFSDRYYAKKTEIESKRRELSKLKSQLSNYESELWQIQSGYNDINNEIDRAGTEIDIAHNTKYSFVSNVLYMVGGFIIVVSCMVSLFIYIFGKRREITAFTTQQVMPVAQEGIEKMAPTIGNAAGEIAKGIKNGLDDDKE